MNICHDRAAADDDFCSLLTHLTMRTVFDPNERADITNPEYVRIHDEYKNLVDFMLGSFMDEMQISPAQFEVACLEGRQSSASAGGAQGNAFTFHQGLFQQIWAANDIRIFVRMMTQRNVELQLQALDLIEHRQQNLTDADRQPSVDDEPVVGGAAADPATTTADRDEEWVVKLKSGVVCFSCHYIHYTKGTPVVGMSTT